MPYLGLKEMREKLDAVVNHFATVVSVKSMHGERKIIKANLNYFLFKLAKVTCNSYRDYSDFIGELESAKLEIYRRQIAPYEDKKIKQNGDVK